MEVRDIVEKGKAFLGMELGSTRIKAVLTDPGFAPVASGGFVWENHWEGGCWTYHMDEVWSGLRAAYAELAADVEKRYGVKLTRVAAMGFSGMMHGYLALDASGELLAPFRTWRNTTTGEAAGRLTERFGFNIPQRWSVAHLYQAILNGEEHVKDIDYLTTLAGYVHNKLCGERVLGVGEASGMFPIDSAAKDYDAAMLSSFDALVADRGCRWKLRDILPKVLTAGEPAGRLTEEGARLLDPSGALEAGISLCPPEGDAGTGMTATNSVRPRTGNVSAGTSIFAMIVLENALPKMHTEIDMVTTPTGRPAAMVHCNNCTNEINAWAEVFRGFLEALGQEPDMDAVFTAMFRTALAGEPDAGGLLLYNYLSGEPTTGFESGCPLLVRTPEARLSFENFMRAQLYSAVASLKLGMDMLVADGVKVDRLLGHGGFFKTPEAGQRLMSAALGAPVSVMKIAGEGGPWGMALLAGYMAMKKEGEGLEEWLDDAVFAGQELSTIQPEAEDTKGFGAFIRDYVRGLAIERAAVDGLRKEPIN